MRIALISLPPLRPHFLPGLILRRCISSASYKHLQSSIHVAPACPRYGALRSCARRDIHLEAARYGAESDFELAREDRSDTILTFQTQRDPELSEPHPLGIIPDLSHEQRRNPTTWVSLLEQYLPENLREDGATQPSLRQFEVDSKSADVRSNEILTILGVARKFRNAGMDILAHMIQGTHRKAALWLCNFLLENLASRAPSRPSESLPSNILWPSGYLASGTNRSMEVGKTTYTSYETCDTWESSVVDPRYSSVMSGAKDKTMDQIWTTMGTVVAQAADMLTEKSEQAMNAVQLVLGQIHNLDLMPDDVYVYEISPFTTMVQRSPIVHLVSSQILTALSDAAWREQQMESIEKAASHGRSYKEIGRDPPGGRFRLKVSRLAPEVWLEFILWCCVEGGFAAAGLRVVNLIQQNAQNPWFAITWFNKHTNNTSTQHVDWHPFRTQVEDSNEQSRDQREAKILTEVPRRTISREVVLALVESHIDHLAPSLDSNGMSLEAVQNGVVKLLSFLEPHDLEVSYFDYVSARLMLSTAFDSDRSKMMRRWSDRLSLLRSLKTAQPLMPPQISFQYNGLLAHSEFAAGFIHQLLNSYVQDADIHEALRAFNDLQKLVDNSKLHAITAFLQRAHLSDHKFFSSRHWSGNPDFVGSHGQLPLYKLAALLSLAIDTNLVGFAQWLLYSDDPDGPLIPASSYGDPGIASTLVRFAGLSSDRKLLREIPQSTSSSRLPTVRFLRASFDARVSLLELDNAAMIMEMLSRAEAGGFGLTNLAHLAGTILKLETHAVYKSGKMQTVLEDATTLLNALLGGQSGGRSGILQQTVRTYFRQNVAQLLVIFQTFKDSNIAHLSSVYNNQYRAGNKPTLPPSVFNVFLEAVIETSGARTGMDLVQAFCVTHVEASAISDGLYEDYAYGKQFDLEDDIQETSNQTYKEATTFPCSTEPTGTDLATFAPDPESKRSVNAMYNTTFIPFVTNSPQSVNDDDEPLGAIKAGDSETSEISRSLYKPSDSIDTKEPVFTSPFFAPESQPYSYTQETNDDETNEHNTPGCIYDARTIRIIVRQANKERQERENSGKDVTEQLNVLGWASQKFIELGHTPDMRSREIRAGLLGPDQQVSFRKTIAKTGYDRVKVNRSSKISRSFRGKHIMNQRQRHTTR